MKHPLILFAALALPAAPGMAQAAPTTTAAPAALPGEASPQAAVASFMAAVNALDAVRLGRLFADGATIFFPGPPFPARRIQSKAEVMRIFGRLFEALRARGVRQGNAVASDLVFQTWGDASIATFHIAGNQEIGRRTLVLRRIGGRWLISHLHSSAAPPLATPATPPQQPRPPGR